MPLLEAKLSPGLNNSAKDYKVSPLSTESLIRFARSGQMSRASHQALISMVQASCFLQPGDRILVDCILEDVQAGLIQVLA
jgi:hypothetical protein